jgi:hypothetical protein
VPMVLCQLVIQTGEPDGRELFARLLAANWPLLEGQPNITQLLGILGSGPSTGGALDMGENVLGGLFGSNRVPLNDFMRSYAGLRLQSASALLQLVAVVLAAELASYAQRQQLSVAQLSGELTEAKNRVYAWLPADLPNWPGFRKRNAVRAPHAAWAAELARPYWGLMLLAVGMAALAFMLCGGAGRNLASQQPASLLRGAGPDSVRLAFRLTVDSSASGPRQPLSAGAATW